MITGAWLQMREVNVMNALKAGMIALVLILSLALAACGATPKTTATPWNKAPMKDGLPWDAYHAP